MIRSYPELVIPPEIEIFILNPIPQKPKTLDLPIAPNPPIEIEKDDGVASFYLIFLGIGFLIFLTEALWLLFVGGFVLVAGVFGTLIINEIQNSRNRKKYELERAAYKRAISAKSFEISQYNNLLQEYNRLKKLYDNSVANKLPFYLSYFYPVYCQILKSFEPRINLSTKNFKRGFSEVRFYQFLRNSVSNLHIDTSIKIFHGSNYSYYPDILYFDKTKNIIIDIEIDEPYSLDSKELLHYDDSDSSRDQNLSLDGVFVLRFSEFQVVKFPEYCLDVLRKVIHSVEVGSLANLNLYGHHSIKRWSFLDAKNMLEIKFRESYL